MCGQSTMPFNLVQCPACVHTAVAHPALAEKLTKACRKPKPTPKVEVFNLFQEPRCKPANCSLRATSPIRSEIPLNRVHETEIVRRGSASVRPASQSLSHCHPLPSSHVHLISKLPSFIKFAAYGCMKPAAKIDSPMRMISTVVHGLD